jgi:hypothetical protein
MSAYNQEFNRDNIVLRYITVATLAELQNKVYYYNQVDEDTQVKVPVPFYYSVTGNERLLLDVFTFGAKESGKAEGDYEVVPRGMLQMTGGTIESGNMTNKFVRSEFVREFGGQLKTYSLETAFLPITMSFDCRVICSNNTEMLKVTESVMSKLYKATHFQVDLGMMRVQASMEVPEDYGQNRLFEFGLNDKKEFEVTFSIEVKSFMPVFEGGILLAEIAEMTKDTADNPNRDGIGMFRNGEIRFGGVIQQANYSIDDMSKAPSNAAFSNLTQPPASDAPPFLEGETDTAPEQPEDSNSEQYRNQSGKEG